MAIFGSILGILTPLVGLFINIFYRNQQKNAEMHARWQATVDSLNKRTNTSIDMSLEYDRLMREQDERLAAEAKKSDSWNIPLAAKADTDFVITFGDLAIGSIIYAEKTWILCSVAAGYKQLTIQLNGIGRREIAAKLPNGTWSNPKYIDIT